MTEALGSTATPESGRSEEDETYEALETKVRKKRSGKRAKRGPISRIGLFYRQIIAEMRKVVWPSRSDLTQYTAIVIVFVAVIIGFVLVIDWGFTEVVKYVFG